VTGLPPAIAAPVPTVAPLDGSNSVFGAPGQKIGVLIPTHGRPDYARQVLLQMAQQTVRPDVVVVYQNGNPDSYRDIVADVAWPFALEWLHEANSVRQHQWYAVPLRRLLDLGCSSFFWVDHDDLYYSHHIETAISELAEADWRISRFADILYLDRNRYRWRRRVRFTSHAPGGMSASMAFNRAFADALLVDLGADAEHHYSDNVVAKVTLSKFRAHYSDTLTTAYVSHAGSYSSSSWISSIFKDDD